MQLNEAYVVSSVRTAVGKAPRGTLRAFRPEAMGAEAVRAAVARVDGLDAARIDDCLIGCAMPEGPQGMNMGRIIALKAGLPETVPGATINRFCSSGIQTIAMASQAIQTGQAECIVAGGAESMSQVPMAGFYFQPDPEMAESETQAYVSMGITAENVSDKYNVSREDQDRFAVRSHDRALAAIAEGKFEEEIVPLRVRNVVYRDGEAVSVETEFKVDEGPRPGTTVDVLAKLRPVFRDKGSMTAGNSSQTSDGAAATVMMSGGMMKELGVEPMARLVGFALAGVPPELMGIGPVGAIRKVLAQTGLTVDDIGLVELNEAFAAQALAVIREAGLDEETVNVNGGAIALGHPLGCTGAKVTATILHEMKRRKVRYGLVTMCVGGGMGAAGIYENLQM